MTTLSKIHYLLRAQTAQKNCIGNGTLRYIPVNPSLALLRSPYNFIVDL